MWISIDGVEGVGKTTLCTGLANALPGSVVSSSFSRGHMGRMLRQAIEEDRHIFAQSGVAQSLMFMAEYRERVEIEVKPMSADRFVLTDRGLVSKKVYQRAVLSRCISEQEIELLLSGALVGLPEPDLSVVLLADVETVKRRIDGRGESRTPRELDFIAQCVRFFDVETDTVASPCVCIDVSDLSTRDVLDQALAAVNAHSLTEGPA